MSVTWACGAPIEMKIHHGDTEITKKTLKKLELRALRVSVVNDFSTEWANRGPQTSAVFALVGGKFSPRGVCFPTLQRRDRPPSCTSKARSTRSSPIH